MPNDRNIAAAKERLSEIFPDTTITFSEKDLGGTNKDVIEFSIEEKEENYFFIIIEPPEKNPAQGIKPKKGREIIKFMQNIANIVGHGAEQDVYSVNEIKNDEREINIKLPYAGIEVKVDEKNGFYYEGGVRDRNLDPNLVNVSISLPIEYGVLKSEELEKAFYIIKKDEVEVTKFAENTEFDIYKAYEEGRAFAGISKAINESIFGGFFEKIKLKINNLLGNNDPYNPDHQIKKLNTILEDEKKLFNVGIAILAENEGKQKEQITNFTTTLPDDKVVETGRKKITEMLEQAKFIKTEYKKFSKSLKKGWVHGDSYFDNLSRNLKSGRISIFDLEESGHGIIQMDWALAVSAREGYDKETGKLNEVGKSFLRGADEVIIADDKIKDSFHVMLANAASYIATMRIDKWANANYSRRSPKSEIDKCNKCIAFYNQKVDLGLDTAEDLTPLTKQEAEKQGKHSARVLDMKGYTKQLTRG